MAADEVRLKLKLKLKLIDVEEVVANAVIDRGAEVETLLRAVRGIFFFELAELGYIGQVPRYVWVLLRYDQVSYGKANNLTCVSSATADNYLRHSSKSLFPQQ